MLGVVVLRPLFETNPVAALVYWGSLGAWAVVELRQAQQTRTDAKLDDKGSRGLIRGTIFAGILIAVWAARNVHGAHIDASRVSIFVVSLILMWAGMALRGSAFRTLGRYFTFDVMTSGDQPVVSSGPYRFMRHPGYAGGVLILAGIGLALGNWISLVANVAIPLVGTVNRIKVEEAALRASLGDRYATYAASRKRLVPFVW